MAAGRSEAIDRGPVDGAIDARTRFLTRVYLHVAGGLVALVAFEVALFETGVADRMRQALGSVPWILVLGAFMLVGWLARRVAWRLDSLAAQYAAFAAYVVAKGIIVLPLLGRAERYAPGAISSAAQITLMGAAALTLVVWWSRADFSFLGAALRWGGLMAIVTIVAALLFGWHLGTWFNLAMITLAGGSILYDTSRILRRWRHDRYVAEGLSLFASIALMFFYVLRQLTRAQRLLRA